MHSGAWRRAERGGLWYVRCERGRGLYCGLRFAHRPKRGLPACLVDNTLKSCAHSRHPVAVLLECAEECPVILPEVGVTHYPRGRSKECGREPWQVREDLRQSGFADRT